MRDPSNERSLDRNSVSRNMNGKIVISKLLKIGTRNSRERVSFPFILRIPNATHSIKKPGFQKLTPGAQGDTIRAETTLTS